MEWLEPAVCQPYFHADQLHGPWPRKCHQPELNCLAVITSFTSLLFPLRGIRLVQRCLDGVGKVSDVEIARFDAVAIINYRLGDLPVVTHHGHPNLTGSHPATRLRNSVATPIVA